MAKILPFKSKTHFSQKPPRPSKSNKGDSEEKVYDIFPDYWKPQWGAAPFLGTVTAFNEFEAERKAYNKDLLRVNFTFGAKAVLVVNPSVHPANFGRYNS